MQTLHIEAVVAFDRKDNGIGNANTLPWTLPKDMARFKKLTKGHAVLMGTQTALSIGKALPYRHNYVLTRSGKAPFEDVMMYPVASIQEAVNRYLAVCSGNEREVRIYVCGGEEVYRSMIPYLTGLHMTVVYEPPAKPHDRFFPNDETFIYHGVKEEFASGNWIMDGKDERIRTFYSHVRFRRHEGAPLLSLPSNVQLARAS